MFRLTGLSAIDFDTLFNLSPNPYVILDRDWRLVGMNDAYLAITNRSRDELTGKNMFDAFPSDPDSVAGRLLRTSLAKVFSTGAVDHLPLIPYPIANDDGVLEERYWTATHSPVPDAGGGIRYILQHTVDVTELHALRQSAIDGGLNLQSSLMRKATALQGENLALGAELESLHALFEQTPGFMAVFQEPDHIFRIANSAYRALVGREDLIGRTIREALPDIAGQGFYELLDEVYRTGVPYSAKGARVILQRPGSLEQQELFLDFVYQPTRNRQGEINGIFVQGHDVTDLRLAQVSARESEERFRTLAQSLPNQVWTASPDGRMLWVNDELYRYSGLDEIYFDQTRRSSILHPEDAARVEDGWTRAVRTGQTFQGELRLRRHDGQYRWFLSRAVPVPNPQGEIVFWVATNTDIDDQKRTESNLEYLAESLGNRIEERTVELERTQEVLRQSQKMEAIGNLAGGIAHDFNNLLQVITGNLQLLTRDIAGNETAEKRVNSALAGASRGAKLASQLLSFGRRQPLAPKVTNLGRLIRDLDHLLRRSLGEAIEIETIVGGGLWNTMIDSSNVENALLNLAINARDAMSGQGKLTVELANAYLDEDYAQGAFEIKPGQFVMLAVTDTGSGMTLDILEKVFDPFFTTKPEGKGTGLGLSMVYGFVKQSGGHIRIYSEPGQGTTVRIYLPRSMQDEDVEVEPTGGAASGGSETILVVEDDEAVRETAVSLLAELGYRVLKARDADSGLAIVESGVPIDLLFTDVVMPGSLKSRDLANLAKARLPEIGILFTSGYTENSIVHDGRLDFGVNLLSKPYTREALARKIRQVIDQRPSAISSRAEMPKVEPKIDMVQSEDNPAAGKAADDAAAGNKPVVPNVLFVEDEALIRMSTVDFLQDLGMNVVEAGAADEALELAGRQKFDVLVTDVHLPDMSGLELILALRQSMPDLPVIFATGDRNVEGADNLSRAALISKPYDYDLLASLIRSVAAS